MHFMDAIITSPTFKFLPSYSSLSSQFLSTKIGPSARNLKKLKRGLGIGCCSSNPGTCDSQNPRKPSSIWQKYTSPIKKISSFSSILQRIRSLEEKTSMKQWVSDFTGENKCLQNGGFGMALLSVTATAKVRISPFVATLAANPTFVSGFFAWFIAQSMKVFLYFCFEKKWDLRIMCASGGMPSSHSALCMALTTSVAFCHGVADSLFPVCLGFSLIVMYDAIGVRRHAGMQAEVLNLIVQDLFQGHPISKRKLKELLGHTPSQVVAGAVLGILVSCVCCQSCFIGI